MYQNHRYHAFFRSLALSLTSSLIPAIIQHTSSDNSLASGYAKLATQQREGLERSAEQGASLGAAMRDA
ncbi:hypothetical protein MJN69_28700, partial [Salmonella enterica subsp. enterica serovar Kentucky]|nr:hypothetical protein [Salmonella enterica subsp. enterica serovar Kentucky]